MKTRREFLQASSGLMFGTVFLPYITEPEKAKNVGVNLYSIREAMLADAVGTLRKLAKIGYKEIESAKSIKGNYYGMQPGEIQSLTKDLGITLRSGHAPVNADWQKSIDEAAEAGQEYIVSGFPVPGQTLDNYKKAADIFNNAGEQCRKSNLIFGYHNGRADFKRENDQVLYDILLNNTEPDLVKMEMDLAWAIVGGGDPLMYFDKYPGRFPLWHIKDIRKDKPLAIELGKGQIDIQEQLKNKKEAQMKYFFVEQEESDGSPIESMEYNFNYLKRLQY